MAKRPSPPVAPNPPEPLFEVARERSISLKFPKSVSSAYGMRDFTKSLTSEEARQIASALLDHAALLDSRAVVD